ncbi:MAG TPA: zf-HC2 domain-containing protein [Vicinamibacterales bacterium]|nr:zf-HC2 domain-containing protein [Vicinamibacterales bacterium]
MTIHPDVDLVLHAGGELPAERRADLESHLATCARCRDELAFLRAAQTRLRSLSEAIQADAPERVVTARVVAAAAMPSATPVRRRTFIAAAAGFVVGASGGAGVMWRRTARTAPSPTADANGAVFMLLLQELVSERLALAPEPLRERSRAMSDWMARLRREGRFVGGQRLRDEPGRIVAATGVQDRVGRVEPGELMSGFFLVRAASYDEATAVAATCPIVSFGGRVVVRQLA